MIVITFLKTYCTAENLIEVKKYRHFQLYLDSVNNTRIKMFSFIYIVFVFFSWGSET